MTWEKDLFFFFRGLNVGDNEDLLLREPLQLPAFVIEVRISSLFIKHSASEALLVVLLSVFLVLWRYLCITVVGWLGLSWLPVHMYLLCLRFARLLPVLSASSKRSQLWQKKYPGYVACLWAPNDKHVTGDMHGVVVMMWGGDWDKPSNILLCRYAHRYQQLWRPILGYR